MKSGGNFRRRHAGPGFIHLQTEPITGGCARANTAGFDNVDLALGKVFRTSHERTIQARFETFNVFNQTNYNGYVGSLSSPLFGQPVSAFDKRRVQLALVYRF